ncbi:MULTISPECIES: hypothetical protein [Okeania]|uniref:Tetratricopeptide repeat protein n=1 Tax=Okeania hirsuta TaxID=1458930 RepID=A0A3N6PJA4_9CYAN|nr:MULTISPECIES: hypothetical protein [Okeania]NET12218.1 hypothetical protein [Okeania sp. SIO1H6]NES78122.1 hypothetical protein [Okeania sp. SIO1H4]NES91956.1 hypothetical protein [Okeania sp. SIO2B9]NET18862.1 hypothetical protein [Okeania sp. SIO1H5]NET76888.1 hypothetical protein [Okeania sp. SIO1F9]
MAKRLAAPGKVEQGKKLVIEGKINEAISLFKEAQEFLPEIDLDPDTETKETDPAVVAKRLAATGKVE